MARDATARLYDVDKDSVVLKQEEGQEGKKGYLIGKIRFSAKRGKLVDLDKLHESLWATRLSGGTRMALNWLEVTAVGEVAVVDKMLILKVKGSNQHFVLAENPKAKPKTGELSPLERLRKKPRSAAKLVSVTGRVEGWSGRFPKFLGKLPGKPRRILVESFHLDARVSARK